MTPWCEAFVPMPVKLGGAMVPCKQPAAAAYRFRCIYGHVITRSVCGDHDPVPGEVGCKQCFDDGLEQPMTWEVAEVAPAAGQ